MWGLPYKGDDGGTGANNFSRKFWHNGEMVEEEGVQAWELRRGVCLSGDLSMLGAEKRGRKGGDWIIKRSRKEGAPVLRVAPHRDSDVREGERRGKAVEMF